MWHVLGPSCNKQKLNEDGNIDDDDDDDGGDDGDDGDDDGNDSDDDEGHDQDNNAEDRTNLGFVSEDENHGLAEAMAQRVRIRNRQRLDILWRIFWAKMLF